MRRATPVRFPDVGDWFRFDVASEPLIIVAGSLTGKYELSLNVCRHRGSLVCAEDAGHSNRLICPYHGWTYDLEGRLRSARTMGDLDTLTPTRIGQDSLPSSRRPDFCLLCRRAARSSTELRKFSGNLLDASGGPMPRWPTVLPIPWRPTGN